MRLVIDCFKLIRGTGKSIGIYNVAVGLVQHLGALNKIQTRDCAEIIVLGNKSNRVDFDVPGVSFVEINKYTPKSKLQLLLWELFYVSKILKELKADKVLFPRGFTALKCPIDDVILIHDMIPFYYDEHFPKFFSKIENAYIMWRLKNSVYKAKKIITISQASKSDIIKYCGINEDKITVINNACEYIDVEMNDTDDPPPYICAMTSTFPHKNAIGIIKSYIKYCEMVNDPYELVIFGLASINEYSVPQKIKEKITCYKYISDKKDMYRIIGGSKAFLFLSLIEGFGLPPVEAMQLGVPVICSNTSSLPEVVGNAAIMVDPMNYSEIANQLRLLLDSKNMQDDLKMKGQMNVKRFTWKICAKRYWGELIAAENAGGSLCIK